MSENTILDLDNLLDTEMDKVETLPDFVTPAPGRYKLAIKEAGIKKRKDKEGKESQNLTITLEILETVEVEGNEPPFPNGSLFSERFQATEEGLQYFKRQAMKYLNVSDMTGAKLRDIFEGLADVKMVDAVITHRKSKGDDGKEYTNINVRPVHADPAA